MRVCHRFGLKRVAKRLTEPAEVARRTSSNFSFSYLAVLWAVVHEYVKNTPKRHIVATFAKSHRLLPRRIDATPLTELPPRLTFGG